MDPRAAARIAALKETPGWDDLTVFLDGLGDKYWQRHVAAMKRGEPIDQREIDFARGIDHGIRHLLKAPEKAAKVYERHHDQQEAPE